LYLVSLQYSVVIVGGMSGGAIALSIALMHGTRITVQSDDIIERINASPMMVAGGGHVAFVIRF
jgi:hypothetical protein